MKNTDNVLRVGGIGTGRIFQFAHLRAYPAFIEKARMVGFYDLNADRAREAKAKHAALLEDFAATHPEHAERVRENLGELRVHDSLESLFAQVDMVDICTHSRGRMPAAIAAFKAGVHASVEKPMARTWTEADRADRVLRESPGVKFQLTDDNVFEVKYRAMRDLIDRGDIGEVQTITLIRGSQLSSKSVLKAQANALENGGGCLMDYGSHGLAGSISLLGPDYRPVKVKAVGIAVRHRNRVLEDEPYVMEVDDNAQIKVFLENAATGAWATIFLEATWCGGHISLDDEKSGRQAAGYIQVVGDRGVLESRSKALVTLKHENGGITELPLREFPGETISMSDGLQTFIDAVREGREPDVGIRYGADVIAVCGAAYLSALRGTAVTLEEFKEYSRGFIEKLGDGEKADDAIILDLLAPYRYKGA